MSSGVRARIRTKDGWVIGHGVLTLADATGTQVARVEADEKEGAVETGPLEPGMYTAIVTAAGYAPAAATALVSASGADLGTIVLQRMGGSELPPPGVWTIDPVHSEIAAVAKHLGLSTIRGIFHEFSGQVVIDPVVEKSKVTAEIKAASIDTGNSMRDDHLRNGDFLNVEEIPLITYESNGLTPNGPDRWTVQGVLTLRGVARPVDLDLEYLGTGPDPWGGTRAAYRATTTLSRDEFAMNDFNPMVRAGIAAVGTTLKVELEIQTVQGDGSDAA
ncbi:YceI family protein [Phaeacidiphilus oryzae]|jgi:polyisoprenoid-binding protein YceI|uniref:YceI family protein n=1 Tax=Phaeacidiphilus oryzae TaxID=348818 RepID=UPI000569B18E|nr:YceI family protein [Phaeacidiphilus oryzae]